MASSGTVLLYQVRNLINGKLYLGITGWSLHARRLTHISSAKTGARWPLAAAIRRHGQEMFRFSVLKICISRSVACAEEIRLIALWKPAYNASIGGDGLSYWTGKKRAPETNLKISMTKTGVPRAPSCNYHQLTREQSASRAKRTVCLNDGKEFRSALDAGRCYGLHKATVASVANGRRNSVYGLRFAYA
jgi:group I intron endonuclease